MARRAPVIEVRDHYLRRGLKTGRNAPGSGSLLNVLKLSMALQIFNEIFGSSPD